MATTGAPGATQTSRNRQWKQHYLCVGTMADYSGAKGVGASELSLSAERCGTARRGGLSCRPAK
jgi:hypothetical protein